MPENVIVERERNVRPSIQNYPTAAPSPNGIAWSAVLGGLVTFISLQVFFVSLGLGIGAATIDPLTERNPFAGLGLGAGIWYFATGLVSLFLAGMVTTRMAGITYKFESLIHGFLTWCLVTVVSIYLSAMVMGGLFSGLGKAAGEAASTPAATGQIRESVGDVVQNTPNITPQKEREVRQTGESAAEKAAAGGIGVAVALLLGALATSLGGYFGRPRYHVRTRT